jgi:hypothetical protein
MFHSAGEYGGEQGNPGDVAVESRQAGQQPQELLGRQVPACNAAAMPRFTAHVPAGRPACLSRCCCCPLPWLRPCRRRRSITATLWPRDCNTRRRQRDKGARCRQATTGGQHSSHRHAMHQLSGKAARQHMASPQMPKCLRPSILSSMRPCTHLQRQCQHYAQRASRHSYIILCCLPQAAARGQAAHDRGRRLGVCGWILHACPESLHHAQQLLGVCSMGGQAGEQGGEGRKRRRLERLRVLWAVTQW